MKLFAEGCIKRGWNYKSLRSITNFSRAPPNIDMLHIDRESQKLINVQNKLVTNTPSLDFGSVQTLNVVIPNVNQLSMDETPHSHAVHFGADREIMIHQSIHDMKPCGLTMLSGSMFNAPVREDIVHQVVKWQLACRRAGTASTKHRHEVRYSSRKLRPQKGTGRARVGTRSAPQFRGGGRAHGPKPTDFSYNLALYKKVNGLRSALTSKYDSGRLWVVNDVEIRDQDETGPARRPRKWNKADREYIVDSLVKLGWESVMVIDWCPRAERKLAPRFEAAALWVGNVLTMAPHGLNCYDILSFDHLVFTVPALMKFEKRCLKYDRLF